MLNSLDCFYVCALYKFSSFNQCYFSNHWQDKSLKKISEFWTKKKEIKTLAVWVWKLLKINSRLSVGTTNSNSHLTLQLYQSVGVHWTGSHPIRDSLSSDSPDNKGVFIQEPVVRLLHLSSFHTPASPILRIWAINLLCNKKNKRE